MSLIVPSHNRRVSLVCLLESIARQDLAPADFEVVVVLDGSTDGSAGALDRPWPFALKVIEQPNRGAGAARNAGVNAARGQVCVFVDDDITLDPGALAAYTAAHAESDRPSCIVGALRIRAQHRGFPAGGERDWARNTARLAEQGWGPRQGLYSGNLSLPRELALRFPFREDLRRLEDIELGRRLAEARVPILFCAGASGLHINPKTTGQRLADLRMGGATWVRLAREKPGYGTAGPRGRRGALPVVLVAWAASNFPLPGPIASLLGAVPAAVPGAGLLFRLMHAHAYLRGLRDELSGLQEWKAYLGRERR